MYNIEWLKTINDLVTGIQGHAIILRWMSQKR